MAYVNRTWSCGDKITADSLNNIERGVQEALAKDPVVVVGNATIYSNISFADDKFHSITLGSNNIEPYFYLYSDAIEASKSGGTATPLSETRLRMLIEEGTPASVLATASSNDGNITVPLYLNREEYATSGLIEFNGMTMGTFASITDGTGYSVRISIRYSDSNGWSGTLVYRCDIIGK